MNGFWQGKICPICKKEFGENDDVVYCPECGTAHHRECWNLNKACFFAREHAEGNFDTTNELSANPDTIPPLPESEPETDENGLIICPVCGEKNDPIFRICIGCGHELTSPQTNPDAYPHPPGSSESGGDYGDRVMKDDITYSEIARYYGNPSEVTMERLQKAADGKAAFTPGAFFGSFFWLLYHKVVGLGLAIALAVFSPILTLYGIVFSRCAEQLKAIEYLSEQQYNTEQWNVVADFLNNNAHIVNTCSEITVILALMAMVFCGFYGMRMYFKTAVKNIRIVRQRTFDRYQRDYYFSLRGGVSLFMPLTAIFLMMFISSVIAYMTLLLG